MNRPIITCIALLLTISSCATLDIAEIESLQRDELNPVILEPAWETHNMRMDVIRQTYTTSAGDSATGTEETPYHPLGFDLGNGLFFDLNDNLTLRLDQVMAFSPDSDFEVIEATRPGRKGRTMVYRFYHDSLTVGNIRRNKPRYVNHLRIAGDSLWYMRKSRMKYAVVETDTSLVYTGKKRKRDAIYRLSETSYYRNKMKRRNHYEVTAQGALLGNRFVVSKGADNRSIQIKQHRSKRDKVLYTMVRGQGKIFLYSQNYRGLKFVRKGNGLEVIVNRRPVAYFELK